MNSSSTTLLALAGFAFVSSITPGPNNLMLLASGTHFGWRRSLRHLMGISLGFGVLLVLTGLGLAEVFVAFPRVHRVLQGVSVIYLGYLAWKTATAAPPTQGAPTQARPMSLRAAAAFQAVNPKAWAMALTAVTAYGPGLPGGLSLPALTAVFVLVNLPCCGSWVVLGQQMRRWLDKPWALRAFNWTAAALMLLAVLPMVE